MWYKLLRRIAYRLTHRDIMLLRLQEYRERGMAVGGVRIFSKLNTGEPYLIEIGNNVTISTNVELITHDNCAIKLYEDATDFVGKITIGDNCFIGANTVVLPGVSIGENSIIGAGSVVTKSIPSDCVASGNPAKVIGPIARIREKNRNNRMNFKGMTPEDKQKEILIHKEKWISK